MQIRRLVSDVECRREAGDVERVKWSRWQKAFADFPPAIEIRGRNHRDRDAWEAFKERLIAASDPAVTRISAARARAARGRKGETEAQTTQPAHPYQKPAKVGGFATG